MGIHSWFSQLSMRQRFWLFGTIAIIIIIVGFGFLVKPAGEPEDVGSFSVEMSIRDIASTLNVTGKALAREFKLPLDISKQKPLKTLGVAPEELQHVTEHLLSHHDSMLKYYVYAALVLGGLVFLVRLGRPDLSDVKHRREWYPRTPYIVSLMLSVIVAGFLLGKSPNPMESVVKVFKSMVGLYPDPIAKAIALLFFIILAVIGNKIICGWACPFGSLQELVYSVPILRRIKQRKLPFLLTNTIRAGLFTAMLLLLFGIIGGRKGTVIYHYINPFNLFDLDFETVSILLTVILALLGAFIVYRPFCQFICPFGFISWLIERFSIIRVRIDKDKCTECGACIKACPLEAAKGLVYSKRLPADCYSCARCLNVCPVDAIQYSSVFKKGKINRSSLP
ncbi:MAG: 4Fe-4S binding protein [Candidatus Tritonobacter lacicola]|nr:4Fe-4S binding protein [Candidatus Tritonobacter lacicola]